MRQLFILASLLLTSASFASVLRQGGVVVHCQNEFDVQANKVGYALSNPSAEIKDGKIVIGIEYLIAECRSSDGNIAFYPVVRANAKDKILVENPHLFSVDTFYGAIKDEAGDSNAAVEMPLSTILTKRQSRKFNDGRTVEKTFWIRYGNYFEGRPANKPTSYGLSSGYYTLTVSFNAQEAVVKSFVPGKN